MAAHTVDATRVLGQLRRRVDEEFDVEAARLAFERARNFERLAATDRLDYREQVLWDRRARRARQRFEEVTGVEYATLFD